MKNHWLEKANRTREIRRNIESQDHKELLIFLEKANRTRDLTYKEAYPTIRFDKDREPTNLMEIIEKQDPEWEDRGWSRVRRGTAYLLASNVAYIRNGHGSYTKFYGRVYVSHVRPLKSSPYLHIHKKKDSIVEEIKDPVGIHTVVIMDKESE